MTQTADAATELAREHDELDKLAIRIATLRAGPERAALVQEMCTRFVIHAQAEERYLYPAVRRLLRDGALLAATQSRRNRAVARTIEVVERGVEEEDELDILVGHLIIGVQDHVERQDAFLLPALIEACPSEEFLRLGEQLHRKLHEGIEVARGTAAPPGDDRPPESAGDEAGRPEDRAKPSGDAAESAAPGEAGTGTEAGQSGGTAAAQPAASARSAQPAQAAGQPDAGHEGAAAAEPEQHRHGLRALFHRRARREPPDAR